MAGHQRGQLAELANERDTAALSAQIDSDRYNGALFAGFNGVIVKVMAVPLSEASLMPSCTRTCSEAFTVACTKILARK